APALAGWKATGSTRLLSALTGSPLGMRSGAANGPPGKPERPMTEGWLPALITRIIAVAVWPTRTDPKRTTLGEAVKLVTGRRPVPVIATVALVPSLAVMVIELLAAPARCGTNTRRSGSASPGLMMVPALGSPDTRNGPAGLLIEVTVTGLARAWTRSSTIGT